MKNWNYDLSESISDIPAGMETTEGPYSYWMNTALFNEQRSKLFQKALMHMCTLLGSSDFGLNKSKAVGIDSFDAKRKETLASIRHRGSISVMGSYKATFGFLFDQCLPLKIATVCWNPTTVFTTAYSTQLMALAIFRFLVFLNTIITIPSFKLGGFSTRQTKAFFQFTLA